MGERGKRFLEKNPVESLSNVKKREILFSLDLAMRAIKMKEKLGIPLTPKELYLIDVCEEAIPALKESLKEK